MLFWQFGVQFLLGPMSLSHCSTPARMKPSPQNASMQLRHPSVFVLLPSSHCSPAWTIPSPHVGVVQPFVHVSVLFWLPSSHSSVLLCEPSPHTLSLQLLRH